MDRCSVTIWKNQSIIFTSEFLSLVALLFISNSFRFCHLQAAIHALASIAGAERHKPTPTLSSAGEASLKDLVYGLAAETSYHTPGVRLIEQLFSMPASFLKFILAVMTEAKGRISAPCTLVFPR